MHGEDLSRGDQSGGQKRPAKTERLSQCRPGDLVELDGVRVLVCSVGLAGRVWTRDQPELGPTGELTPRDPASRIKPLKLRA